MEFPEWTEALSVCAGFVIVTIGEVGFGLPVVVVGT